MSFNYPYASPWASFSPFGGGFASGARGLQASPYGGYGGFRGFGGMCNWLMRHASQNLWDCWGGNRGHSRHCCDQSAQRPATLPAPLPACTTPTPAPAPAPAPAPLPAPLPTPVVPAAPVAPPAPASNAPKEGSWSSTANGFMVGQTGEVQVRATDFGGLGYGNYPVQYRATDGTWTSLGTGADLEKKGTAMIKAKPGDKVEFRVLNPNDMDYLSMTTGKTPLKSWPSSDGNMIGACGFKLYLSDPNAKG